MVENRAAIDRNCEALKRTPCRHGRSGGPRRCLLRACVGTDNPGSDRPGTLPRHLYVAVLRLLRPAVSATRRLVIALARGIVVALPPQRPAKPKPGPVFLKTGVGPGTVSTGIVNTGIPLYRLGLANVLPPLASKPLLLRPARQPSRCSIPCEIRSHAAARASGAALCPVACTTSPSGVPFRCGGHLPPTTRSMPRLGHRLAALASALDDMPAQAQRFARWQARRDRFRDRMPAQPSGRASGPVRFRRIWPLRPGRPPGGRLSEFAPGARRLSRIREVDEVLAHAHALACYAMEQRRPDTS